MKLVFGKATLENEKVLNGKFYWIAIYFGYFIGLKKDI